MKTKGFSTTLNPFSRNYKYAYQRDRFLDISKAIGLSSFHVANMIVIGASITLLGGTSSAVFVGAIPIATTPQGMSMMIAAISGIALAVFLGAKCLNYIGNKCIRQLIHTHHLIWHS